MRREGGGGGGPEREGGGGEEGERGRGGERRGKQEPCGGDHLPSRPRCNGDFWIFPGSSTSKNTILHQTWHVTGTNAIWELKSTFKMGQELQFPQAGPSEDSAPKLFSAVLASLAAIRAPQALRAGP